MKNALLSALLAFAAVAASLAVLEIGVRILLPEAVWRFHDPQADWRRDPQLGWVNRPNLDVELRHTADGTLRYRTNPDGLAPYDAKREREPGSARIMIFGDSMVVGRAVDQGQIYTARLEQELEKRGIRAEVINAGVQGYSTDQVLLWMERMLPIYRPDVVAYGSTLNDFGGNSSREAYRQPKPMFVLEDGELRLIEREHRDAVRPLFSRLRSAIQHSALYRTIQPRLFQLRARFADWKERNMLGLMQQVYTDPAELERIDWDLYSALLARMEAAARRSQARFFVFPHPEVAEVWDPYIERVRAELPDPTLPYDRHAVETRSRQAAEQAGVGFLPTIDFFASRQERGPFHLVPLDPHLSPAGHALLAELLSDYLVDNQLVPGPASSSRAPARRGDRGGSGDT